MKTVVITGSTRGIGYGMAEAFLNLGCAVMVSGRSQESVDRAVQALGARYGKERVSGKACDVSDYAQVQALWDAASSRFQRIDYWINNAGQAHGQSDFQDLPVEQLRAIIETNMLGTLFGTRVALQGMRLQGGGAIYNMEGLGSTGRHVKGMSVYGTTKAGLGYFNKALADDVEGSPITAGALRPGMVVTDMLTVQRSADSATWEQQKRIFNILAEKVETVAPILAKGVLENTKNGAVITVGGTGQTMLRFLTAPFTKRKVID
jgi:NAD(P)-dependent dehydrogenase (short-subunit alcohol dehydrogenase family)